MINAMKYKEEISNVGYDFGILEKNNKIVGCGSCADEMKCQKCKFGYDEQGRSCDITRTEWLCQEYKESNKKHKKYIKLTRLDYELLKFLQKQGARYISRDKKGSLNVSENKPKRDYGTWLADGEYEYCTRYFKGLLSFVESCFIVPVSIQNVLDNCEVVENVGE